MANSKLLYIIEEKFKELIESEAERVKNYGKNFILNPRGFGGHLIGTGNNNWVVSNQILQNYPNQPVSQGIVRTAGFMHDWGKFSIGDPYHEIQGAYEILTRGEELELVAGGSKLERRAALKRIAACLPSDAFLFEEIGSNFLETALYPKFVTDKVVEQWNYIKKELSQDPGNLLDNATLTFPETIEQKITIWGDFNDFHGREQSSLGTSSEILAEISKRYNKQAVNISQESLDSYHILNPEITAEDLSEYYLTIPRLLKQKKSNLDSYMEEVDKLLERS